MEKFGNETFCFRSGNRRGVKCLEGGDDRNGQFCLDFVCFL